MKTPLRLIASCIMSCLLFVSCVSFTWSQTPEMGRITGKVLLNKSPSAGKKTLPRWVSEIVVYLVPVDHQVESKVSSTHIEVSQKNARFVPDLLVIAKGQTIDFINDDNINHNVFSFSQAKQFDLGIYPAGVSKSVTFNQEGPVLFFCSVHENMNGVIYVTPNNLRTVTDGNGNFSIAQIPVGKYKLRTWHKALPATAQTVQITAKGAKSGKSETVTVDFSDILAEEESNR